MDDKTSELFCKVDPNIDKKLEAEHAKEAVAVEDKADVKPCELPTASKETDVFAEPPPKPLTDRQLKAAEKKRLKEEEKQQKALAREKKRQEGIERNRVRARERYYQQQAEKELAKKQKEKEINEKIVADTKSRDKFPTKDNSLDFNTFAGYMLKYENLKLAYKEQIAKETKLKESQAPKTPYHPPNYPLGNRLNPRERYSHAYPTNSFY